MAAGVIPQGYLLCHSIVNVRMILTSISTCAYRLYAM